MKLEKYFIIISIGILILFVLSLYAVYNNVKEQTIQDVNVGRTIHAQQAAVEIEDHIKNVVSTLNFLSRFHDIIELNAAGMGLMKHYQELSPEEIKGVTRLDAHGKIIYTYPDKESIGKDISHQEHIRLSMITHEIVVSNVFAAVHVPAFDNGSYMGTLAFLLSFDKIAQNYIENIHNPDFCGYFVRNGWR